MLNILFAVQCRNKLVKMAPDTFMLFMRTAFALINRERVKYAASERSAQMAVVLQQLRAERAAWAAPQL